ncbi:MAG: hypothetical protein KDA89_20180, partial [Planctomycetaceae bacterium]|nr:hypothetical protein [Planctomycetaceae bacterium]
PFLFGGAVTAVVIRLHITVLVSILEHREIHNVRTTGKSENIAVASISWQRYQVHKDLLRH